MDYEKKDFRKLYEDLVKSDWFKKAYHDKSLGDCPFDIPELRESEDERIRKEVVNFILYKAGHLLDEETEHKFIAYLEKQKESLHISETCKENADSFTDEDETIRRKMIEHFKSKTKDTWCNMPVKSIISYLEKQKEQKPADRFEEAREKYQVEWSEEDESYLQTVIGEMEVSKKEAREYEYKTYDAIILWLKSLRPQPKQKRQIKEGNKVSIHCRKDREKDIITIYDGKVGEVIHVWDVKRNPWGHIGVRLDNGCNHGFYEDELEVLDELSWKPSEVCYGAKGDPDPAGVWKPSEEQMDALLWCTAHLGGADRRVLAELYEHLKKLM